MTMLHTGGESQIYKDGERVFETLGVGESLTVPGGETWIVETYHYWNNNSRELKLNGEIVNDRGDTTTRNWDREGLILKGGDTIEVVAYGRLEISGWSV